MAKPIPSYLKLVSDPTLASLPPECEDTAHLDAVCNAFSDATGWELQYGPTQRDGSTSNLIWSAPVAPGVGAALGQIGLALPVGAADAKPPQVSANKATHLAESVAALWQELVATRLALWQREAELAAGVPVTLHADQSLQLATTLEAVLQAGAQAVGCDAAALYLLDAATTELKLRASWGLPTRRMMEPARPLRGAVADLEALLGHAVVVSDRAMFDYWRVPEPCGMAVCVPVATGSTPLGTLWAFGREARELSDVQTNLLEVVAGRLAVELERQMLLLESVSARRKERQWEAASRQAANLVPSGRPTLDGWSISAQSTGAQPLSGAAYDWFTLPDGSLLLLSALAAQQGPAGAITTTAVRSTARALSDRVVQPGELLARISRVLWTGSAGDQSAGVFAARLVPNSGALGLSATSPLRVMAIGPTCARQIAVAGTPLGQSEECSVDEQRLELASGGAVMAFGVMANSPLNKAEIETLDRDMVELVQSNLPLNAAAIGSAAGGLLAAQLSDRAADAVVLVIKRVGEFGRTK